MVGDVRIDLNRQKVGMRFWQTVRADLKANVGSESLKRLLPAFFLHPGFSTVFLHRIARHFYRTPLHYFGVAIWLWNLRRSGCHIHFDSEIEPGLQLPHPVAVVIGAEVRIETGATIYQSVTIGRTEAGHYPVIGKGAVIYPSAIVIGPITIGERAVIGAGSVVRRDVPDLGVAAGNPARLLRIAISSGHSV